MKVFLVATEESGDRLGAALMQALKTRLGPQVAFRGVGGYEMAAQGLPSLFRIDDLAIVGLAGITQALPKLISRIRQTARAALDEKPDVLVIIDSPDFTHRVARRVRKKNRTIPIVNYVSPSVWAWRPGRARAMSRYIDHVLALLPFEPDVHKKLGGPPCTYVGHPLVEQIDELRPNAQEAAQRTEGTPLLLVLPGSRKNEIRRLIEPFGRTVERIARTVWPLDIVIPTTPHLQDLVVRETARWPLRPKIVVKREDRRAAFRAARAALAKSGTVTLELGVSGVPMVTAYKMASWEVAIARRLIRVPSVILTNLVLGENVVPEFIQNDCTPDKLAAALTPLLTDSPARRKQVEAFARLDQVMEIGVAQPARRAAEIVEDVAKRGKS
ncbi:lipid-A-disaccharide synthase [Pseudorhodoplanes sp.]|uniref:lipid-A-disaccharide synthase n=1 Tax=Pseudorhodoplanes sp. TaxID=1934341 RepID=UPI00391B6B17